MEVTVEGRTLPNDRQGRLGIHFADSNSHESTAPRLPRLHLGPADLPEIAEPSGGSTLDSPHDLHSNPGRARDGPRSAPSPYQTQAGGRSLAAWHRAESGRTSRDWRECAACGAIIANALLMMEVYPQTKDKKAVRFHGDCYTLEDSRLRHPSHVCGADAAASPRRDRAAHSEGWLETIRPPNDLPVHFPSEMQKLLNSWHSSAGINLAPNSRHGPVRSNIGNSTAPARSTTVEPAHESARPVEVWATSLASTLVD
jgi:hypothetical protein